MQHYIDYVMLCSSAHLAQTHETYFQHARKALLCSWLLLLATLAAFIHAFVPGWFTSTASTLAAHVVRTVAVRNQRGTTPDGAPMKAH